MMDDHAFGLSKRRVTVSTAGVVPGIEKLQQHTDVSLAISLHAPSDELRTKLVPINKNIPLPSYWLLAETTWSILVLPASWLSNIR